MRKTGYLLLICVAMGVVSASSCRKQAATKVQEKEVSIYLDSAKSGWSSADGVKHYPENDEAVKKYVSSTEGALKIILIEDVTVSRIASFMRKVIRSQDISVTMEANLASKPGDGKPGGGNFKVVKGVFEFPLADGNTKHWQYKVIDRLEKPNALSSGYDERSSISYHRIDYTERGFFLGGDPVSAINAKKEMAMKKVGNGKTAVGIVIHDKDSPTYPLLEVMNALQDGGVKVVVIDWLVD